MGEARKRNEMGQKGLKDSEVVCYCVDCSGGRDFLMKGCVVIS